ncbi:MAG: iron ABC transporter permease [Rhodospirillales bacterium]|nr:iron ABC transporter permease [Rhodospirillales bacterium]
MRLGSLLRHLPGYAAALLVGALLFVFIVVPLGSVLVQSFYVSGPYALPELKEKISAALDRIDDAERESSLKRWVETAKPQERMEAIAASLTLIGKPVPWDRKASFDIQIAAAEKAVAALDPEARQRLEAEFPIAIVMLHKRIPLAFKIRDQLSEKEFDELRLGARKGYGLDHYLRVIKDSRLLKAGRNSVILATTSCVLTTLLAFLIAYGVNRGGIPAPNLVRYATLVPLVSPPVIIATAAILLFGRNGAVTKGLLDRTLGWINADDSNLYGWAGVIIAQMISHLPPAFIILDNVLAKHDGRLEEAAASQGATTWQVFRHVTLPLAQPGIIRAVILVFIVTMTDFGNPLVIGRDIPVLAGILYDEMLGFQNSALASAMAMWMIVPAVSIYFLLERLGRRKRYDTGNAGGGGPSELAVPLAVRAGLSTLAWVLISFIILIYGTIVAGSFVRIWGIDNTITTAWYTGAEVAGYIPDHRGLGSVWQSLKVAAIAAPIGGLLAVVVAYLVERVRPPGRNVLSFVTMLPAILPGVIFGVGYIVAFNFPFGQKQLALTSTMWILVLNILFANIFVGVLAGRAILQRLDASVDEAAEILGASLAQRFTRVVLPTIWHAALLGTLYVFVHGMTTLSAVAFLVSPGHDLAAVAIFEEAERSLYGAACALSVTILAIVFAVMAAVWWAERRGPAWARIGAHATGRA